MRPRDRQLRIIDLVRTEGKVTVEELARKFTSSAETIRRDLTFLSANGKIKKIHGGAVPQRDFGEGAFAQRMQQNAGAKRLIADKARQLVSPGDSLFIDTGSTTLAMAETLGEIDGLTVVTNSTAIAKVVSSANQSTRIYLLGGSYNEDNRQTLGAMALNQLNGFHGNLAIVTVGAVSADAGLMDYSFDEAAIASAMIARSDRVIVLIDASKFDRVAPFVVASFEQIDVLVSDSAPQGALAERLKQATVEVI
jgi:DeoR family glycerol-3-phosphate regulon repressor